jgi:hypothetical protein
MPGFFFLPESISLVIRVVSEKSLFRAEGKICLRFPSSVQGDKKIVESGGSVSRTGENLG